VRSSSPGADTAAQDAGFVRPVLAMLVPYAAILVFWHWFHSAWATILSYHCLILAFSWHSLGRALTGWNRRLFFALAIPCAAAGPATWLMLPQASRIPVLEWLAGYGLAGTSLILMIPYYGLVHPILEQAHWSSLRRDSRLGLVPHPAFAGYHVLVLVTLMRLPWIILCVGILIGASVSWRWAESRKGGGLLIPVLSQVLADGGMIVAAFLRASWPGN
jgi:hypothetical protein